MIAHSMLDRRLVRMGRATLCLPRQETRTGSAREMMPSTHAPTRTRFCFCILIKLVINRSKKGQFFGAPPEKKKKTKMRAQRAKRRAAAQGDVVVVRR